MLSYQARCPLISSLLIMDRPMYVQKVISLRQNTRLWCDKVNEFVNGFKKLSCIRRVSNATVRVGYFPPITKTNLNPTFVYEIVLKMHEQSNHDFLMWVASHSVWSVFKLGGQIPENSPVTWSGNVLQERRLGIKKYVFWCVCKARVEQVFWAFHKPVIVFVAFTLNSSLVTLTIR